jgi:hypothetical protein
MPPPSHEQAAADAVDEIAAYAFIRAWMADDVDKGMLLIKQHHVPPEAALFVMSLVRAASRALLSAEGAEPVGEQREHASGVDGAELVLVADRHDPGTGLVGGGLQLEQVGGIDLASLVEYSHVARADFDGFDSGSVGVLPRNRARL